MVGIKIVGIGSVGIETVGIETVYKYELNDESKLFSLHSSFF
jgi:hypothetical protein